MVIDNIIRYVAV